MQKKDKFQIHNCYKYNQYTSESFSLPKLYLDNSKTYSINSTSSVIFTQFKSNIEDDFLQKVNLFLSKLQDKLQIPSDLKISLQNKMDLEQLEKILSLPNLNVCYSYENQKDFIVSKNSSQNLENQFIDQITHLENRNKQLLQTIEKLMYKDEKSMEILRELSMHYFSSFIDKIPLNDYDQQAISNIRDSLIGIINQFNF